MERVCWNSFGKESWVGIVSVIVFNQKGNVLD